MAEKGFGVKEVNLIGASGTPTITSPNNLNLNANNVAISTNVSIGGTLSVTGNVSVGGTLTYEDVTNIDSVGVVTARSGLSVTGGTSFFAGAISAAGGITGTATTATNITVTANNTANETVYPLFSDGASGSQGAETDTGLTYNPNTNLFTAGSFSGGGANLTSLPAGQLTGTVADARISTLTASKLSGALPAISGANLTNIPAPVEAPVVNYTVTANGSSGYRFSGGGVDTSADDPDLYLIRGQKYRFNNTTGSAHPFQFRLTTGGSAYTAGVSGDQNGVQFFTPELDAPAQLYYICTLHSNMVGNIYLRGAGGNEMNVGVTTSTNGLLVHRTVNADISGGNSYDFTLPANCYKVDFVGHNIKMSASGTPSFQVGTTAGMITSGGKYNYTETAYGGTTQGRYQSGDNEIRFGYYNLNASSDTGDVFATFSSSSAANMWLVNIDSHRRTQTGYLKTMCALDLSGNNLTTIRLYGWSGVNFASGRYSFTAYCTS